MRVEATPFTVVVTREKGDKRIRRFRPGYYPADPDSTFLHEVQKVLRAQGLDVIKRRMQRDGHLMGGEATQYLRDRRGRFAIFNSRWQIALMVDDYNNNGVAVLSVASLEG